MFFISVATGLCCILYAVLFCWLLWHWKRAKSPISTPVSNLPYVTVVIAARNEANQIGACLSSLHKQVYPIERCELILIDDHSDDETFSIVSEQFPLVRIYRAPKGQKGKKAALYQAIQLASHPIILATDADCTLPPEWLLGMTSPFQDNSINVVAGPVLFFPGQSLIKRFQELDFVGMMMLTNAGLRSGYFALGNGANLAFRKAFYIKLLGEKPSFAWVSGDDVFLVQGALHDSKNGVLFLKSKELVVQTEAMSTWSSFINQRLRWASKTKTYHFNALFWIQAFLFGYALALLISLLYCFFSSQGKWVFIPLLLVKGTFDFICLWQGTQFFSRKRALHNFFFALPIQVFYILIVGAKALLKRPFYWKDRRYTE